MSLEQKFPKVAYWCMIKCPFCGEEKPVVANGLIKVGEDTKMCPDRGYAFCNCKNIWFCDWKENDGDNVKDNEQDILVFQHHLNEENILNGGYQNNKIKIIGKCGSKVAAEATRCGFDTEAIGPYNIVWAYHIIEHACCPLLELKDYYDMLTPGGRLFLATPDPYFIEFDNIYTWGHWSLRQHHIMWDMDSLCDEAEKIGFKIIKKIRNMEVSVRKDMHLILER